MAARCAGAVGVRAGVDAITPNIPLEARGNGYVADTSRTAPWRWQWHNNEWWYYTPNNAWMYHRGGHWNSYADANFTPLNQYSTGYRGVAEDAQSAAQQAQHNAQTQGQAQVQAGAGPVQRQANGSVDASGQIQTPTDQPQPQPQPQGAAIQGQAGASQWPGIAADSHPSASTGARACDAAAELAAHI